MEIHRRVLLVPASMGQVRHPPSPGFGRGVRLGADCSRAECVYDPNSDHRRKGVYKEKADTFKARETTLQTIMQAILDSPEDKVSSLVQQIRHSENLDDIAETIAQKEQTNQKAEEEEDDDDFMIGAYSTTIARTLKMNY